MAPSKKSPAPAAATRTVEERAGMVIRFAGDSGDGMQLVGAQFSAASAALGNDLSTLPDFPAEIRAPAGSLAGVSGFQVHFSREPIHTPGDFLNALLAMNPAALKANLPDLEPGGVLIVNSDAFTPSDLKAVGYPNNPLEDGSLARYRCVAVPMSRLHEKAVAQVKLNPREVDRGRNFFALGLVFWLFERPLEPTLQWIGEKFAKNPAVLKANTRTLKAGYQHGEKGGLLPVQFRVSKAQIAAGKYRKITGNEALSLGLVAASRLAGLPLVFACHPITPASDILHHLVGLKQNGVRIVQAEDEAAALCMALGAAFGGGIGATATSGPGMSLMGEALGLGVMTELPCVIINVQRGGPSTGLPTKTEQADLFQALVGRHGEAPLPVLAPASASDCFAVALEAVRLAIRFMTPVVVLSDVYLANGAEPWKIPAVEDLPAIVVQRPAAKEGEPFLPYGRNERLVRPWAIPGTPGLEHRVGGLEKEGESGQVGYDPQTHEAMVRLRALKIANVAAEIPPLEVQGKPQGDLLVLGWGGTKGAICSAVERCQRKGQAVSCAHLRHLHPLPRNTGAVLGGFRKVLVPELNHGQLSWLLRSHFLVAVEGLNKVQGRPFLIGEVEERIQQLLAT